MAVTPYNSKTGGNLTGGQCCRAGQRPESYEPRPTPWFHCDECDAGWSVEPRRQRCALDCRAGQVVLVYPGLVLRALDSFLRSGRARTGMKRKGFRGCRLECPRHTRCTCCWNPCPTRTNGMGRKPYNRLLASNDGDEVTNFFFHLILR